MTDFSIAFSYGVSYEEYLSMDTQELNQAILGGQLRESREMRLLRILTWIIGSGKTFKDPNTTPEDIFPLNFDDAEERAEQKKITDKEKWKWANEFWAKRDRVKKEKNG